MLHGCVLTAHGVSDWDVTSYVWSVNGGNVLAKSAVLSLLDTVLYLGSDDMQAHSMLIIAAQEFVHQACTRLNCPKRSRHLHMQNT